MPAEQNHWEKCIFTWKVGVLTWESCDGFCRGKTKARIREESITHQALSSLPVDLQWPSGAGGWLCPTGATRWEQHREPAPAGHQTDTKSFDSNTLQRKICLRLRVIWIQPGWPESSNDKASPRPVIKPWNPLNFQKWFWFLAQFWHCYSHGNCFNSGQWCPAPLHLPVTRNKGKWYFSFFQDTLKM